MHVIKHGIKTLDQFNLEEVAVSYHIWKLITDSFFLVPASAPRLV